MKTRSTLIVALHFLPVSGSYLPKAITAGAVFDYIWFTPTTTIESTCDRLRKKGQLN